MSSQFEAAVLPAVRFFGELPQLLPCLEHVFLAIFANKASSLSCVSTTSKSIVNASIKMINVDALHFQSALGSAVQKALQLLRATRIPADVQADKRLRFAKGWTELLQHCCGEPHVRKIKM